MSGPVNTVPVENGYNQLSPMQREILRHLATCSGPMGNRIGHMPRTGDIIDAIGRPRTNSSFASVSRSLGRLQAAGLIDAYRAELCTRGDGAHWSLRR